MILSKLAEYAATVDGEVLPETVMHPSVGCARAWVFETFDFAEEAELKYEVFAVRFKNAENARVFKDAYAGAQRQNAALGAAVVGAAAVEEEEEPDDL